MHRLLPIALLIACSDYKVHAIDDGNNGADAPGSSSDDPSPENDADPGLESGDVSGQICDPSGDGWVVGAYVYVAVDDDGDGQEDWRAEDLTDGDGYFLLSGLPTGGHTIVVEKGSFSTTIDIALGAEGLQLATEECLDPNSVSVAVVSGEYDAIEELIASMELDYDLYNGLQGQGYLGLLTDLDTLMEYDIVFLNCGINERWMQQEAAVVDALQRYVAAGGSVYASDWSYRFVELTFPGQIDFYGDDNRSGAAYVGNMGSINATVLDPDMKSVLGSSTADLNYDLDSWAVITASSAEVLIRGDVQAWGAGPQQDVPLAVQIDDGGRVIYTTFHNEQQITVDMESLLMEIILKL